MISGLSIEPFRGDYENLERMAHLSWREEYGSASFPNFYRPAFLRYMFERVKPGERDHLIAAYRGDEIVGFMGNVPQRFHFHDRIYPATYSCLLVIRRDALRQGLATALIEDALRVNDRYHYAFSLFGLETGHRSTKMIEKFVRGGRRVEWIKKFRVIGRVLDLDRVAASEGLKSWERAAIKAFGSHRPPRPEGRVQLREFRPGDLDGSLALLNRYQQSVTLALVWDREGLAWELSNPGVVQTLVYEKDGRIQGLINFIYHDHLGKTTEKWAWIHHLAYPDLTANERLDFIHAFLRYIRDAGCLGAIEWTRGYYPQRPFYRARFFPYFRAVNLCSWTFDPELTLGKIKDVYEIQV
jgi:GNAT superfamily N-acetyltransferase